MDTKYSIPRPTRAEIEAYLADPPMLDSASARRIVRNYLVQLDENEALAKTLEVAEWGTENRCGDCHNYAGSAGHKHSCRIGAALAEFAKRKQK